MNDLLAGTSLIIGIAAANAAQDRIGFKEFLESTPPIEELVYEVVPSETNQPAQSFFVRWQNGAYVVRRSPKLSWVTEPLTSASVTEDWISGKYGSNWWKITPGPTADVKFWPISRMRVIAGNGCSRLTAHLFTILNSRN